MEKIIFVTGPTGSGKSEFALDLVKDLAAKNKSSEIISADSIAIFRKFNIGTAKPSPELRAQVPHHLIDICDPEAEFTVGDFVRSADPIISRLHGENKIPIVVGGSGFYIQALLQGMAIEGAESIEEKTKWDLHYKERLCEEGMDVLYQEMISQDPILWTKIDRNDTYRILRALVAMKITKKKWSELNKKAQARKPRYKNYSFFCFDLPREELQNKIQQRTKKMLSQGLLDEVQDLLAQGVPKDCKPFQSVGYRECVNCMEKNVTITDTTEVEKEIVQATMRLVKQQRTWFRARASNPIWIHSQHDMLYGRGLIL